jgi:hypothetical protein
VRKEVRLLKSKALNSLMLAIEHFNRPWDRGRTDGVLIFLDHGFEMLLKAAILHRGGRIRDPRQRQTIGFDTCVRRALDDGKIKFITSEQALTLQIGNGLRDAAQHHYVEVSEAQLYVHAQAGLTLFRDLLKSVFLEDLRKEMPERVLPISVSPPTDLAALFEEEVKDIQKLLNPKSRRRVEAAGRLKALAIVEASVKGERFQPSEGDLSKLMDGVRKAKSWEDIFPGVASVNIAPEGSGPSISLRLTKKEGIPVQLVPEGTPGASVVAIKRVDELGFYNLGRDDLAKKVGLTGPKTTAVVRFLKLQDDTDCYKVFIIGKTQIGRYSQKAIDHVKQALEEHSIDEIWRRHGIRSASAAS